MTQFSPAAMAVDHALASCIQLQGERLHAQSLAAVALLTVADQIQQMCWEPKCVDHLRSVAIELQGQFTSEGD